MTAGRIVIHMAHQGESYTRNLIPYALMNGQAISRATFSNLSERWPANMYGGGTTSDPIHLPDTQGLYLRGANLGATTDPDGASRTALSGVGPTGNNCGSFQENALIAHTHASGTVNTNLQPGFNSGSEGTRRGGGFSNREGTDWTKGPAVGNRPFFLQAAGIDGDFEVDHTKVYFYIED